MELRCDESLESCWSWLGGDWSLNASFVWPPGVDVAALSSDGSGGLTCGHRDRDLNNQDDPAVQFNTKLCQFHDGCCAGKCGFLKVWPKCGPSAAQVRPKCGPSAA